MNDCTRDRIFTCLENGVGIERTARRVGRPPGEVRAVAGLGVGEDFIPSRRQIAAATRQIRRDWSDETRQLRETIIPFHSPELIR